MCIENKKYFNILILLLNIFISQIAFLKLSYLKIIKYISTYILLKIKNKYKNSTYKVLVIFFAHLQN